MDSKKFVKKKPVARYFGAGAQVDHKDVQRIPVDTKKKTNPFKGDVIQVDEQAKFFFKSKYSKQGKLKSSKFLKQKNVKLKLDPYALQKHSSEFNIGFNIIN